MANSLEDLNGRRHFDYIVAGCGGIGSGAVYWLAREAGLSVLGLERFELGHANGSSQDVSRGIRLAYDDDKYIKLARHAYSTWAELERESGLKIVHKVGYLGVTRTSHESDFKKYEDTMRRNNVDFEIWDSQEIMQRFPQLTLDSDHKAIWQKDGGVVSAALANTLHISLAQGRGAKVLDNCPVNCVARLPNGRLQVSTPKGIFTCRKLVVTSGAWINNVISSIGCHVPVYVTEENVTYFATPHIKEFTKERFPLMYYHHASGNHTYVLSEHIRGATKIGIDAAGPVVTGDTRGFEPDPIRLKFITDLYKQICPKILGPVLETKSCLYTMTPDRHFLIDTCHRQGYDDVIVCCGAGHAFKFASLLGKILSEMAVHGRTQYDISGFSWDRQALTDPNFQPICFSTSREDSLLKRQSRL